MKGECNNMHGERIKIWLCLLKMVDDRGCWSFDYNPVYSDLRTSHISLQRRGKAVYCVVQFNEWVLEKKMVIIHWLIIG